MIAQIDARYIKKRPSKTWARLVSYLLFEGRPLTTKGRWINPLVFGLFALEKRLARLRTISRPIFVIGTGRSGTTILGVVLSMHRDVGFLNEPKALWHAAIPFEDLIGSYSLGQARYRLTEKDVSSEIAGNMKRLYSAYLTFTGSRRICDKYPELVFRIPFVRAIFPDAKFLFLVRNGWDTCRSIDRWSGRLGIIQGRDTHDWWGANKRKWDLLVKQLLPHDPDLAPYAERIASFTEHTDMAAVEWILTMREGLRAQETYPTAVKTVSFERLSTNPRNELLAICEFCELDEDSVFMDYGAETLRPVPAVTPFALDHAVEPAFHDVMERLGYA